MPRKIKTNEATKNGTTAPSLNSEPKKRRPAKLVRKKTTAGARRTKPGAKSIPPTSAAEPFDEMVRTGRLLTTDWDRYNGKVDAVFRPSNMSPRELEQGVAWFADQFYALPSIFDRLLCKSRVGIWWNLPRNLGYRLALHWRAAVRFDGGRAEET